MAGGRQYESFKGSSSSGSRCHRTSFMERKHLFLPHVARENQTILTHFWKKKKKNSLQDDQTLSVAPADEDPRSPGEKIRQALTDSWPVIFTASGN